MLTRRNFIGTIAAPAFVGPAGLTAKGMLRALETTSSTRGQTPEQLAADEEFWFPVQQAFTVDRSLLNLNNGGVCPSPAVVQDSMKRHLDYSNTAPAYTMWRVLEPQREAVRQGLARFFGCDPNELALTRNASEGLQICQFGFDLKAGDEVLTTNQDYPRMITTWRQRERRDGVVLREFSIPVPAEDPDELTRLFEENISERTKLILMCHVINLTGQVLPVRAIVRMARKKGVPVVVDGAHSFAHFDFKHADLECDFFATSLHKWLFAPHGTGLLYVQRDRISKLWPLMAAPERMDHDIRKFEEIGTHPAANYLAISEALAFHEGIGSANKEARLRYLTHYWVRQLLESERVRLHTSLKPGFSCALANVQIEGVDSAELASYLWQEHRILVASIRHPDFEGIRVTPCVYTTLSELDRFCDAMRKVIRNGLPART